MTTPGPTDSSGDGAPSRALIIGSGYRVRNAFLPALRCLDSRVRVVGLHSRTPANARRAADHWGVPVVDDLRAVRPGDVDVVLVSVTVTNNIAVLKAVSHLAPQAALVIDTPGLGRLDDLARLAEFRRWRTVRVAEDFMNMPQFRLVGRMISAGALGRIERITMAQMGYRYHALALVRSWLDFAAPSSARRRRVPGGVDITYRFPGGRTGEVAEPYAQAAGDFAVSGTDAALAGQVMGHPFTGGPATSVPVGRLSRIEQDGALTGFRVDGLPTSMQIGLPYHRALSGMGLEDDSEFNILRIDGLAEIISSLWRDDPLNSRYRIEDAINDNLVSWAARYLPRLAVPPILTVR